MKAIIRTLAFSPLLTACLEPLASDVPGYSPRVLEADAAVATPGTALTRTIAEADGLDGPVVAPQMGFAAGAPVRYWDFGVAPGVTRAAHRLHACDGDSVGQALEHPILISAIPGDADYSPFLALQPVCVSADYAGERLTSLRALRDAIDIGLVEEPRTPERWIDAPVVPDGVTLGSRARAREQVFYDGLVLESLRPLPEEPWASKFVPAGRVYELRRASTPDLVEQVVFGAGASPLWNRVSVIVMDVAELSVLTTEEALFSVDEMGAISPVALVIESFEETRERVHRAIVPGEAP